MQPATRELLVRQDVPVLFLAWLVPAALLLLLAAQQGWTGAFLFAGHQPALALAGQIWPLSLLLALVVSVACCSLQIIGKPGMLVALSYCAVSLTVLGHFTPGNSTFSAFQLVLVSSLLAFCLMSRQVGTLAFGAGLCAAALLASGAEAALFVGAAVVWMAAEWVVKGGGTGAIANQKTLYFGYSFVGGTIILNLFAGPGWGVSSPDCGPLSLAYLIPASIVGLGLVHLASSTVEFSTLRSRLYGTGMLALIAVSGFLAVNPSCVLSPGAAMAPRPDLGIIALFSHGPASAYILTATPLIGLCAACIALWADGPHRSAWFLLLGCLLVAVILMAVNTRFALFANALAIIPCAWLTLLIGRYTRTQRPTPVLGAIFILVWLAGMSLTHSVIGKHLLSHTFDPQSQISLAALPAKSVCTQASGPEGTQSCL